MTDEPILDALLRCLSDISVERALLGLILSRRSIPGALRGLEPSDFFDPLHRAIYAALCALHARGQAADAALVVSEMRRDKSLGDRAPADVLSYLDECLYMRPTPGLEGTYARQIVDLAGKRKLWILARL